jgi:hypothetical protein
VVWSDVLGFGAAAASLVAFSAKTMIPLRVAAILSNALFVAYGIAGGLWTPLVLHAILLPLNVRRLVGMKRLVSRVQAASEGKEFNAEWLRPYMKRAHRKSGETIFRKGDEAGDSYYIVSGEVHFPETGGRYGAGALFGEMGIFTPDGRRTATAVCATDAELLYITRDELKQLYFQNPEFGFHLVEMVVGRLTRQVDALQSGAAAPRPAGAA